MDLVGSSEADSMMAYEAKHVGRVRITHGLFIFGSSEVDFTYMAFVAVN